MTDYDFRQHIGEWVETRGGKRVKVVGYNSEATMDRQLIVQYQDSNVSTRSVYGRFGLCVDADTLDLVPPVREYTTRVKLFRWNRNLTTSAIAENRWNFFDRHESGRWISEPTEVTFKLVPGVKLP